MVNKMSKERELLARVAVQLLVFDLKQSSDLVDEIRELLAQPEPFTPDWVNYRQGVEDSKRKPLSDDAIQQIINIKHFDTRYILQQSDKSNLRWYKQGVKDAEKAHGIGGGGGV